MRRQLTAREWMLLGVLGIMLLVSGYILLFYTPMTAERDRCISETETCRMQYEAASLRIAEKHRMEQELEVLFAAEVPPLSIPDYDNVQPVMFELNSILADTESYSLTFSTVDASQTIIRRSISMSFTTSSYASARAILQRLHDSDFRCMQDNISISFSRREVIDLNYVIGINDGSASVSGTIVFFEYQNNPQAASGESVS